MNTEGNEMINNLIAVLPIVGVIGLVFIVFVVALGIYESLNKSRRGKTIRSPHK
jgi:uncharacterized membrane protein